MNFTISEENYLKAIYHLQEYGGTVNTNAVAGKLATKAASVTDMMKKLSAKGLLNYMPYYGFSLSSDGKKNGIVYYTPSQALGILSISKARLQLGRSAPVS